MRIAPVVVVLAVFASGAAAAPPAIQVPAGVDPSSMRVTTFASGLTFPTGMQQLSDSSILVGVSNNPSGGSFYQSTSGSLLRFTDTDNNGVADGAPLDLSPIDQTLPGAVTSIRRAGNLLFVNHANEPNSYKISVLRAGATPTTKYTTVGRIDFNYPSAWQHQNYALAVRPTPGGPANAFDLLFNTGSRDNNPDTPAGINVAVSGLLSATLIPDSIHKVTVTDNGGSNVSFTNVTHVATGLRNAAGIAFHPTTGDLWFEDNGIDGLVDSNEPRSADELNRIALANIGGAVEDFGFSSDYIEYRTGNRIGSGAIQPEAAFIPIPNPANGAESEGANEIAFAPSGFPNGLNNGVFVGFHGKFNLTGINNEENAVVYYDLGTDTYYHFIAPRQAGIGHLDGLLATSNSLFLSDLTTGSFAAAPYNLGSVYQVAFIPEPSAITACIAAIALMVRRRK
jgi:glucose/arabinose dehydrogenase